MRREIMPLLLWILIGSSVAQAASTVFPGATWAARTPVQVGMDAAKLDAFRAAVGGSGPGCVIKDGYLVYSWGTQTAHGEWASATKPVFATMVFFAIQEGKISGVNALVKDQGWALSTKDQTMTFHHMANMISGYTLPEAPGARWAYNE